MTKEVHEDTIFLTYKNDRNKMLHKEGAIDDDIKKRQIHIEGYG